MQRHPRTQAGDEEGSSRQKWLVILALGGVLAAAGGWYLLQTGRSTRLAANTIALQERLLDGTADTADRRRAVDEIMRNIDRLPPAEIRRVRDSLFKRINAMRTASLKRFAEASPDERIALLDEDLDRIRLVRGIMDATDQGGMRPYTEAELVEREQRRKEREERAKQQAAAPGEGPGHIEIAAATAAVGRTEQAADYVEALMKRAKEKKVDLGRTFSRPPGRG